MGTLTYKKWPHRPIRLNIAFLGLPKSDGLEATKLD